MKVYGLDFKHWGGTMLAYYTNGNFLTVKKLLGYRRVESTVKYIERIQFKTTVST